MPTLTFKLDVRDVAGKVITDPLVHLRLARPDDAGSGQVWKLSVNGKAGNVALKDAPAGSPLKLRLSMSRYRDLAMFATVKGDRLVADPKALQTPRVASEWLADFRKWSSLDDTFVPLQKLLLKSETFQLGRDSAACCLAEGMYDQVSAVDKAAARAKMAMLNLYSRLREEGAPGTRSRWIHKVKTLFLGSSERLLGEVTPEGAELIRSLSQSPGGGYKFAPPDLHKKNFELIPGVTNVRDMVSVKTDVDKANLQLTIARANRGDAEIWLLDADIDENGALLAHTFDLIRHMFTGGTDPIDIHESLCQLFPDVSLGYGLTPLAPIGTVSVKVKGATR